MNVTLPKQPGVPADCSGVLDITLERLAVCLDNELPILEVILGHVGRNDLRSKVRSLHGLHLDPAASASDVREIFAQARDILGASLEALRGIPVSRDPCWSLPEDWNAMVGHSGTRVGDIVSCLEDALRASD
jgi:hypothetical protein